MKKTIITLLTLFSFLILNAQSPLDKRIDFSVKKVTIKDALRKLSNESKVNIAFSSDFFSRRKRVTIDVKDETLKNILNRILIGTSVEFMAVGQQIVVTVAAPKQKEKYTISGYIEDESSGERLISVSIYNPDNNEGTTTNEYGFFSLTLPEGKTELVINYVGCDEVREIINLKKDLYKSITLQPSSTLSEVVVLGNSTIATSEKLQDDHHESIEKLREMPMLGRGGDLMKQVNFLPGVESGVDGLGGMFVRGGNVDQNLTLLDGVSIYNPNHLLGLFSVYNANAAKSTKLYKGDFPARYGGRISSVLDVRTKEGNNKTFGGELNPGFLSSRVTLEGPIIKDKLAFFGTTRFSQLGLIGQLVDGTLGDDDLAFKLNFYDVNLKFHYLISSKDKLYLSFYAGQDIFRVDDSFNTDSFVFINGEDVIQRSLGSQNSKVNWGNSILALRWNHLFNHQLFSNTTLTFSRFNFNFADLNISRSSIIDTLSDYSYNFSEYQNQIVDIGLKMDFDYVPSPNHYFRFGTGLTIQGFGSGNTSENFVLEDLEEPIEDPDLEEKIGEFGEETTNAAIEWYTYIEDEITISDVFKANLGLRLTVFGNDDNKWYGSIEPRLRAKYFLNRRWSLDGSISRTNQNLHLLSNTGLGLPIDIWIPSSEEIRPQTAWQKTLGLQYEIPKNFKFKVEGFYKKMKHQVLLRQSIFLFENLTLSDSTFIKGTGTAYGVEFSLEKEFKKLYTFGYYTLSKTNRKFDDFNLGKSFPFQYDRRHSLKLGMLWNATKRFDFGLTWTYHTGVPRFYDTLLENITDDVTYILDELNPPGKYNQKRTPAYHRLDLKLNWTFEKDYGTHQLGLSVYNLYYRRNVTFYSVYTNTTTGVGYVEDPISIAPILPSFNYSFRF